MICLFSEEFLIFNISVVCEESPGRSWGKWFISNRIQKVMTGDLGWWEGRQEGGELQGRKHGWASYRWWVVGVSLAWVSGNLHTIILRASPLQTRRWIQPPAPTCRGLGLLYIGQVLLSLCRGCQGVLQVEEEHQVEWQVLEKEILSVRESEGRVPNWPYWP